MTDGKVIYRKADVVAYIEDDNLDMSCTLEDLVQDLDFSFEEVTRFMCFLPSLLDMCKVHNIDVINIPTMPTLKDYKIWKDEW